MVNSWIKYALVNWKPQSLWTRDMVGDFRSNHSPPPPSPSFVCVQFLTFGGFVPRHIHSHNTKGSACTPWFRTQLSSLAMHLVCLNYSLSQWPLSLKRVSHWLYDQCIIPCTLPGHIIQTLCPWVLGVAFNKFFWFDHKILNTHTAHMWMIIWALYIWYETDLKNKSSPPPTSNSLNPSAANLDTNNDTEGFADTDVFLKHMLSYYCYHFEQKDLELVLYHQILITSSLKHKIYFHPSLHDIIYKAVVHSYV